MAKKVSTGKKVTNTRVKKNADRRTSSHLLITQS